MFNPASTTANYRADIDGLRGVAVFLVVAFHLEPLLAVSGGFIGVDVFFVISGYLITGAILEDLAAGTFTLSGFYLRRARRILPALVTVLCVSLIIGWFALWPAEYVTFGLHTFASALFFPNFVFWKDSGYFGLIANNTPLIHLWSLGIEEQFYIVWPTLLLLLRYWKIRPTGVIGVLSLASLAYCCVTSFTDPAAGFYSPLSRLWELGVGGILAAMRFRSPWPEATSFAGLTIILAAAFVLWPSNHYPGFFALAPVTGSAMVIAGRSRILNKPGFVAVGLISYPLYLWHWPLLSFAHTLNIHTELAKGLTIALSVALAWLTTRYVEYPIRFGRLKEYGAPISGLAALAVALCGFVVFNSDAFISRFPAEIQQVFLTPEYRNPPEARIGQCWIGDGDFSLFRQQCRDGKILVWGDSYSGALAVGLPNPHAQFTRNTCLPLLTGDSDQCLRSNAMVVDEILRIKPQRVILFGFWLYKTANWHPEQDYGKALRNTLHLLAGGIDDVVLVGPSPYWAPNLPYLVYRYWSKNAALPDRLKPTPSAYRTTDESMRTIASMERARFVSFYDAFCNDDGCLTHTSKSRSELLAWDYGHLTAAGAAEVVARLGLADQPAAAIVGKDGRGSE